ncbi:glycosylphosphatidylinositol anchor attachment 1 protein isoform X1 [Leguminivora glycinivorella]|uniref:glycosylphosphatidylinositol anchor attachment 1 protein isoform X1 n=1 Tax=Leguminivora glycinivorella TaxID=1035111 RepID=UPI00200C6A89|nr:glycosylphosphatidylinositol anchor attachment 1 protein isoform X1 [Leguminivora glycinivorella]
MGLLSDPEYRSVKWVRVLKKVHRPVCFVLYVAALAWFAMLGSKEINHETYFSENALLPGLVTTEFNGEHAAKQFFEELTNEIQYKLEDAEQMPLAWLVAKMSQLHLEVYTHNFTLDYPLGKGQVYHGTNVYGILRAPRTASLEALVLTAPHRAPGTHQKDTAAGIALMLAFAQFARSQKYWAKDIIFLVTEHEQLGMQAWLEAYHGIQHDAGSFYSGLGGFWAPGTPGRDPEPRHRKCLNPGTLKGRSGAIQAAINLEIHSPKIKYIEVKVEGLNGQLPNLDLCNLVHKLCLKSGVHHAYKSSYSWVRSRSAVDEWLSGVSTLLGQVVTMIAGVPNGNHGLFHRFGIEAVTLEGRDAADPAGAAPRVRALTPAGFYRLGTTLESILRSLNNLLEKFHQSYFFYMLAGTNRFISIGYYMPSLCLLCAAMLVRALSLWVTTQHDTEDDKHTTMHTHKHKRKTSDTPLPDTVPGDNTTEEVSKRSDTNLRDTHVPGDDKTEEISDHTLRHRKVVTESKESKPKEKKAESKKKGGGKKGKKEESSMSIVNIGANYLLVHLLGYAVMNSPILLSQIGAAYDYPSEISVYYGLVAISVLLTLLAPLLPRRLARAELELTNILVLLELATVCLSVGMHNYPLGLALAAMYTPVALLVGVAPRGGGEQSATSVLVKRSLCLLLQPLAAVSVAMMLYSRTLFPEEGWPGAVTRGRDAALQAVMFAVADSLIYGNWLFNVASVTLLPIWIIFWQIACSKADAPA